MVQSFKKSLKKSRLPPRRALQEFLIQYRRTPLAFGLSPSELLNGRQIRTKLDVLLPSPAHLAQGRQAAEATKAQEGTSTHRVSKSEYQYQVGTPCYAQYFGPRRNRPPRWVSAVVTRVCGTRSVYIRVVPNRPIWRRHYEQLRPRYGTREEDADPGSWSGPSLSGEQSAPPQSQPTAEPIVLGDRPRRRNPRYPSDDQ